MIDRSPGDELEEISGIPHGTPNEHGQQDASDVKTGTTMAETRTRAECYEALRAAVDQDMRPSDDSGRPADVRSQQSDRAVDAWSQQAPWDGVDRATRPPLDAFVLSSDRACHILDGDDNGGGHRHGTGRAGKTEFPSSWDDNKIIDHIVDVARSPDQPPIYQKWNGRWLVRGTRDDVEIVVIVARDGRVWSGWPRPGGPGVVKNPEET